MTSFVASDRRRTRCSIATKASSATRSLSILILTTTFPPRGGSSVQRVYYQAKLLTELGHSVQVITAQHQSGTLKDDGTSFDEFPESNVVRTPPYSSSLQKIRSRISRLIPFFALYPDEYATWKPEAKRQAASIIETRDIDVILVSRGSPSALQMAWELKTQYPHLKVAIDIRDLWVDNPVNFFSRKSGSCTTTERDRQLEQKWMAAADLVLTVSPHHRRVMSERLPDLPEDRIRVIHNGFDEELFAATPESKSDDGILTLRYLGFVVPTQRIDTLFEAFAHLDRDLPDLSSRFRCEFYGGSSTLVRETAARYGIEHLVEVNSYVSHETAVSLMKGADALLLMWTADPGCMCGKFYEYMRANQYILAIDQGNLDAREVLEASGRGDWVDGSDVSAVANRLRRIIQLHERGEPILDQQSLSDISVFSRTKQTEILSSDLTRIATT